MRKHQGIVESDFQSIFARLREILQSHAGGLVVSADKPDYFCLQVRDSPRFRKSFPVTWVKISKSYVGFHFMPVYFAPALLEDLSPRLKARMQGKSCFNFKSTDEQLFKELERLVTNGLELSKEWKVF